MVKFEEFKNFAFKGNMFDMAVGVIIGGAFGKIVSSLVNDIIMPVISIITGKMNFENMFIALDGKQYATLALAKDAGVSTINYGLFITQVIDFLIMAFVIFLFVRQLTKLRKRNEKPKEVTQKQCPYCKTNISIDATRCPNCTSQL